MSTGSYPGLSCSKPDQAIPELARILISVLELFGKVFCLECLPFSFSHIDLKLHQALLMQKKF